MTASFRESRLWRLKYTTPRCGALRRALSALFVSLPRSPCASAFGIRCPLFPSFFLSIWCPPPVSPLFHVSFLLPLRLSSPDRSSHPCIRSTAPRVVLDKVDEAFSWLQEMRARGLEPNRVTYSALINACGRAGQLARAFQTLDEMVGAGIEPNVITWTTLIDACGKGMVSWCCGASLLYPRYFLR